MKTNTAKCQLYNLCPTCPHTCLYVLRYSAAFQSYAHAGSTYNNNIHTQVIIIIWFVCNISRTKYSNSTIMGICNPRMQIASVIRGYGSIYNCFIMILTVKRNFFPSVHVHIISFVGIIIAWGGCRGRLCVVRGQGDTYSVLVFIHALFVSWLLWEEISVPRKLSIQ